MYADALRRGAALCANPSPNPSDPSGDPAARDPGSGLNYGFGAPQRENGSGVITGTAASNPGSRGAPAAGSSGGGAACEAALAEAEAACAASSGVAAAAAAGLSGEGSAAEQPDISKLAPGGSAPSAHGCRPAGSSAHKGAGKSALLQPPAPGWDTAERPAAPVTAPAAAGSALLSAAARGADSAGGPAAADAEPAAGEDVPLRPASTNGNAVQCTAHPVGEHTCLPAAVVGGKGSANGLADSLMADNGALEEAAARVADSAGAPTAPAAVPPTGKAALLPAAVAAINASAGLAGDPAVIDMALARGAKAAAAILHRGASAPVQPRALPKDACFAEVRAHAPTAQHAACPAARTPGVKWNARAVYGSALSGYVWHGVFACYGSCDARVAAEHGAACSWLATAWQECVWLPLLPTQAST